MSVRIALSGAAATAVETHVPALVEAHVASGITGLDGTLWGPDAESEATKRLGWTQAVSVSRPLVAEITALREELRGQGVDHIVLGGMGGSSLAPEVITRTAGVELTVLDSTDPGQVLAALGDRLATTAVVISSKSGSTLETDSQKRVYEKSFREAGIDPTTRIVIVTDPGSPLDESARADGYRVFNADPDVGGRYSALTAFGLVPSGLAGADIGGLLDEAEAASAQLAVDDVSNPGLVLGAAIAGTSPLKDKLGIVSDGTHIVGFGEWVEQLIAESTGKLGTGLLPVVLPTDAPSCRSTWPTCRSRGSSPTSTRTTRPRARSSSAARSARRSSRGSTPSPSRAACSRSTRSTSPTWRPPRSPRAACSTTVPLPRPPS